MTHPKSEPLALARYTLSIIERNWFSSILPRPDFTMSRLLLRVYVSASNGTPMCKKEAAIHMGVEDVKTGRKFVTRAIELGLVRVTRDKTDKRKDILLPTDLLARAIKKEMEQMQRELESLAIPL